MIRHILFWNYTDKIKQEHREKESLEFLKKSVNTMNGQITGLMNITIGENISDGYDLVFYAEFTDKEALLKFKDHPLHQAHKEKCKDIVTDRLCGDLEI